MLIEHLKVEKDYFHTNQMKYFKSILKNKKTSGTKPEAVEMLFIGNPKSLQTEVGSSYLFPEFSRTFVKIEVI
jgi:hypothetical protein